MDDRKPTMDDLDLKQFALATAAAGVAVGGALGLAVWLLPGLLVLVVGAGMPTAAGLVLMRWVDRWWQAHSVSASKEPTDA